MFAFIHDRFHLLYRHSAFKNLILKIHGNNLINTREGLYHHKLVYVITLNQIINAKFDLQSLCPLFVEFSVLTAITPVTHKDMRLIMECTALKMSIYIIIEEYNEQVFYLMLLVITKS